MTKAEVKARYPKGAIPLTDRCWGAISFAYVQGRLDRVDMEWSVKDQGSGCAATVRETLLAKYGEPTSTTLNHSDPIDCGYGKIGDLCRALGGETIQWWTTTLWETPEGISVRFSLPKDSTNWSASWSRSVTPDAGAAGKL